MNSGFDEIFTLLRTLLSTSYRQGEGADLHRRPGRSYVLFRRSHLGGRSPWLPIGSTASGRRLRPMSTPSAITIRSPVTTGRDGRFRRPTLPPATGTGTSADSSPIQGEHYILSMRSVRKERSPTSIPRKRTGTYGTLDRPSMVYGGSRNPMRTSMPSAWPE